MSMKYVIAGAAALVALGVVGFMSSNDLAPPAGSTTSTPAVPSLTRAR